MLGRSLHRQHMVVEAHAKRYGARAMALVGVADSKLTRQLLAGFPGLRLETAMVESGDKRAKITLQERASAHLMARWSKAQARRFKFTSPGAVSKIRKRDLDVVVMWQADAKALERLVPLWLPRIKLGGWLMGLDHRDEGVRRLLAEAAPGWQRLSEGVWAWRVRSAAPAAAEEPIVAPNGSAEPKQAAAPDVEADEELFPEKVPENLPESLAKPKPARKAAPVAKPAVRKRPVARKRTIVPQRARQDH